MKSFLRASLIIGFMSLVAFGTAEAGWKCKMHNARGQVWVGTAATRAGASANAMRFCARNARYAANCVLDWCQPQ